MYCKDEFSFGVGGGGALEEVQGLGFSFEEVRWGTHGKRSERKNEKRALISDIWGTRGATYGEKGVRVTVYCKDELASSAWVVSEPRRVYNRVRES